MPSQGWAALGDLLGGGGNLDRQIAAQNATAIAGYRSAQTEDALANAKKAQTEATAAEQVRAFKDQVGHATSQQLLADELMGPMLAGGMGGDYSAYNTGRNSAQKHDLTATAADPNTPALDRTRALGAIKGDPYSDLVPIGAGGVTNITAQNPTVTNTPLGDALVGEKGANVALRTEQAEHPERFRSPTAASLSPDQIRTNARAKAEGTAEGTGTAKRALDLPQAKSRIAATDAKFDRMGSYAAKIADNENLWKAVGIGKPLSSVPGTEAVRIKAMLSTLKSQVGFAVLQDMRENSKTGGALGNVSDRENQYLQNSIAALDDNLAPEDLRDQLREIIKYASDAKQRLHSAFDETYPEGKTAAPASGAPAVGTIEEGHKFKGGDPADPANWEKL